MGKLIGILALLGTAVVIADRLVMRESRGWKYYERLNRNYDDWTPSSHHTWRRKEA